MQPTKQNDIMCGRGTAYSKRPANIKFLAMIKANVGSYIDALGSNDRSIVLASMLTGINESRARFIKKDQHTKEWYVMSQDMAHDKIGHSIRDMIAARSKAKKKSKSTRKSITAEKNQQNINPSAKTVCFEPICHLSDTFLNHDITRAFSMKSSDLLASVLELNHQNKNCGQRLSICSMKMFHDIENDIIHESAIEGIDGPPILNICITTTKA